MATSRPDPVSWPFLPVPVAGRLEFPSLDRSVRDAIRIILTTQPGEQLMRPRFGAGLQRFLNEGNTVSTRARIQAAILEALTTSEARAAFDRVDVDPVPDASNQVQIRIFYRLLRTGVADQLGLQLRVA